MIFIFIKKRPATHDIFIAQIDACRTYFNASERSERECELYILKLSRILAHAYDCEKISTDKCAEIMLYCAEHIADAFAYKERKEPKYENI